MTGRARPRGAYYATGRYFQDRGGSLVRMGREVARQARTAEEAMRRLDAANLAGYVQLWIEREQRRIIVAERDNAGRWYARDPFTGTLHRIER